MADVRRMVLYDKETRQLVDNYSTKNSGKNGK